MISVEVSQLSKVYRLYQSPAQRLKEIIIRKPLHSEFVALDDINFSIPKGETFGIIGENGAGKSTLLKILAKTLKPSRGTVLTNGRVAALLELGAGFNPELSGEENIFLNAYLMGLSKADIDGKKEEIISFSELESFIKRPVKTYSSGMHVRLAFSIAACIDPDILIVDEALSVGDQHFQKKCIDRMMQFIKRGKTIVFCSHSLYFVQELCSRAVWLQHGRSVQMGEASKVINAYNDWTREKDAALNVVVPDIGAVGEEGGEERGGGGEEERLIWMDDIRVTDREGSEHDVIKTGQEIQLRFRVRIKQPGGAYRGHVGIALNRNDEETVFGSTTKMDSLPAVSFYDGMALSVRFPSLPILSGQYFFTLVISDEHALHLYDMGRSKMFSVEHLKGELGIVRLDHTWELPVKDLGVCDKS